jgi:L-alanine-DL-glutamate epimerase-like enolase superfamily enzyme
LRIAELRERTVSIAAPMRNAAIGFGEMTASALVLVSGDGTAGYAFDSIGRYGKGALLRERFFPRLVGKEFPDPVDPPALARAAMDNEKPGGHGERPGAIGLIEAAAWDLRAKAQGLPLWRSIADYYGTPASAAISVYATCGHFGDRVSLADEVRKAIDLGYRTVKIKALGKEEDFRRLERIADLAPVAIDLNGADAADQWFARAAQFEPAWIEEPVPPLDFLGLRRRAENSPVPLATGENLFSYDDARNLLHYGGLRPQQDFVQIDPLLAYGVDEYVRILHLYSAWPRQQFLPHAGHLFNAHCVAGLGLGMAEAAPDSSLVYGGYWDGVRVDGGGVKIPDAPGVGYEAKANLFAVLESI